MNSLSFVSSLLFPPTVQQTPHNNRFSFHSNNLHKHHYLASSSIKFQTQHARHSLFCATNLPEEGVVAVMNFDDLVEKDWSIMESDSINSKEDRDKIDRIISTGNVSKISKVLVSIGSDDFVDRLVESSSPQLLLVVHESLLSLACIKERHDNVKCWQGELIYVPEKWTPFDVVFLYFLPAVPFKLEEILESLSSRCSTGTRVVISHLQGRAALEQQRKQYPNTVVSDLPDSISLEKVGCVHSFVMKEYVDDPNFYLSVLEFQAWN